MHLAATPRPIGLPSPAGAGQPATPPLVLPGEHFAAALAFLACGAAGLIYVAPDLARGAFFLPRVVAVAHLFTLGWIMLSIFGALCQFLPVAVGQPLRSTALAHASFALEAFGAALFVGALASGAAPLLHLGASAVALAFVLFASNLAATLAFVRERSLTWWALAGAAFFLFVTPVYGLALALNLRDGALIGADRFTVVAIHAHVALAGVVLLVMAGVAHRLLPMFLLSHGADERAAWASVALLFAGAVGLALPVGGSLRIVLAGALVSGGVVAFLAQAAAFFRHRMRRAIDPGMRLAGVGLVGLAVALILAPFALGRGLEDMRLLVTYFVVLLGAITLFVAGHYYKIVPFLVWYHRFGPLVGTREVPKVADLYSARVARLDGALLVAGWVGLVASIYAGAPILGRASAVVFMAGAIVEVVVIAHVARRRPV